MVFKNNKLSYSILFGIILLFASTNKSVASNILFQDNFNDGNVNDWTVPRNGCTPSAWSLRNVGSPDIPDYQYGIIINNNCVTETIPSTLSIPLGMLYSFEVDMAVPDNTSDRNFVFKYNDQNNWYDIHIYGQNINIQKVVGGSDRTSTLINSSDTYTFQVGQTYHFKVDVLLTTINLYINGNLIISTTDPGPYLPNFSAGLQASGGGDPTSEVWFDNVVITQIDAPTPTPTSTPTPTPIPVPTPTPTPPPTPSPTPTTAPTPYPYPSLNVIDLKQYDVLWKNVIYDTAENWTSHPSIERWGCALTSASMILNYYGYNILPDALNTWLKNQPDGYLSNGLVNWIAITRYSKIFSSSGKPALEYKRLGNDSNILINELAHSRPAILEVPNHFIVAKSQTESSFGINDPAYSNKPTLLSYSNTFKSLRNFTPSYTDLSYVLLTIDPSFELNVFDDKGKPIEENTYTEDPLIDDVNGSEKSNPIKVFEYAKPTKGKYSVEIEGNGYYTLISYLYDKKGNLNKTIVEDSVENDQKDVFTVTVGKKNIFEKEISLDQIFDDLKNLHKRKLINNHAYKNIKFNLNMVERFLKMNRFDIAKRFLELTKKEIKMFTPWAVKPEASATLLSDIENLLKSF